MKILVLYHGNCPDGFGAALAAWKKFGEQAEYIPVQYGEEPPDVFGRECWILDFSYKRPHLESMKASAKNLYVIDHHRTAEDELAGLDYCHFDGTRSGAILAWGTFHDWQAFPPLLLYIEDRDLWLWKLPFSREISAAIASYPRDFAIWDRWLQDRWDEFTLPKLRTEGEAILRYKGQAIKEHVKHARKIEIDGYNILAVNCSFSNFLSEVAGELAKGRPFGVAWFENEEGKRVYSLRSTPEGLDVSEIARNHGGGGHKHAAGFQE